MPDSENGLCPNCGMPSEILGLSHPTVYDGILFFVCVNCEFAWPHWFGEGEDMNLVAIDHADNFMELRKQYRSFRAS